MRIEVDQVKCQGHARCYAIAPDAFSVDEYGQSSARHDGLVPVGAEEKVRLAIANCPEYAIREVEG
jgi:ferredoxin